MSEKDQIHTLLADLAGAEPPVDIDLDRQIERGRRRVRRRSITAAVAAVAVSAVAVGGIITFRPNGDGSEAPVVGPGTPTAVVTLPDGTVVSPVQKGETPSFSNGSSGSTEKSRALLAEVRRVIPELAQISGARLFDMETVSAGEDTLHAGADRIFPGDSQVTVAVDVGRHGTVPPLCDGTTGINKCTEIRHLPDGSIAYLHAYIVPATEGHAYDVRLDRPDGFSVSVTSAAWKPKGAKHDAPLSLERVLEIAKQITVKP